MAQAFCGLGGLAILPTEPCRWIARDRSSCVQHYLLQVEFVMLAHASQSNVVSSELYLRKVRHFCLTSRSYTFQRHLLYSIILPLHQSIDQRNSLYPLRNFTGSHQEYVQPTRPKAKPPEGWVSHANPQNHICPGSPSYPRAERRGKGESDMSGSDELRGRVETVYGGV